MSASIDYGPAPLPAWRTAAGEFIDGRGLRTADVEIDLTGDVPVVRRAQYPRIDHPWADNWPTWPRLSSTRD